MGKGRTKQERKGGREGDCRDGGGGGWGLKRKNMQFILHILSVMEVIKANFLSWRDKINQMKASLWGGGG